MDIWIWWFVISRFFGVVESLQSTRGFEMHVISRRTGKMIPVTTSKFWKVSTSISVTSEKGRV